VKKLKTPKMDDGNKFGQAPAEGSGTKHLTGVQRRLMAKKKKEQWKKVGKTYIEDIYRV
jgi:hypothetical protein